MIDEKRTVLVVDDNEELREVAQEILETSGFRVVKAASAEAALVVFDQRGDEIDLLLSDLTMPGMSGIELADRLRRQGRELPIVLMSTRCGDPDLRRRLELGDLGFVAKPYTLDSLARAACHHLEQPPPVDGCGAEGSKPAAERRWSSFFRRWLGSPV